MARGQQHASDTLFDEMNQEQSKQAREASTILINRNLFSSYYLGTLFDKAVRTQQGETGTRMPKRIRERLQDRWDKYTPTFGSSTSYARTREAWLESLFISLGYEPLDTVRAELFKEASLPDGYFLYQPAYSSVTNPEENANTPASKVAENAHAYASLLTDISDTEQSVAVPLFDTPEENETSLENEDLSSTASEGSADHAVLISFLSWGADFDRPFTSKMRRNEMPHKLMERLLASGGSARWGLLCNGRRIRLLKRDVVAGRQNYFEVDLEALFDNHNEQDAIRKEQGFDTFWTLFRAQAFQPGADGRCLLDILEQESRKHAEGVSARLKTSVFEALETLMAELVNRARMLSSQPIPETGGDAKVRARQQRIHDQAEQALKDLPKLYTQSLVYLYRLLFVLYAESRDLLPVDNAVYRDAYSLEPLRNEIEQPDAQMRYQPDSFRLWETLQALFRLIHRGCNTTQLVVPAYNGNLFDPHSIALLQALRVSDRAMYKMLLPLSVTPPTRDRGRERIDYRDLGVEQLGAVYEGLLEFEPRIASKPMVEVRYKDMHVVVPREEQRDYKKERDIETGQFYLGHGAGRKMSGSYYTPQPLVDFLVERTLKPLVEGKKPEEILELKIVDPAMGSGAFLVGACLYLADAYARAVREQEQLDGGQSGNDAVDMNFAVDGLSTVGTIDGEIIEEEAEVAVQEAEESGELPEEATRPYRRLVAERCLYGVDLSPMAVELAKVSLWLTTLAGDKPLTFLDANLRCGNSLIGAPLHRAGYGQEGLYTIYSIHPEANKRLAKERGITVISRGTKRDKKTLWDEDVEEAEYTIFDELNDVKDTVPTLVDNRRMISEQPSDTVENVHEKAALFQREIVNNEKRQMLERICNLWIATWFWKQPHKEKKDGGEVPPLDGQIYRELVSYIREQFHEGLGQTFKIDPMPYFAEVAEIIKEVRPFHWELEFPEVYFASDGSERVNPGFSAVLGNPPWDGIKPNFREFFAAYDPGFRELERVAADNRQAELLKDEEIKNAWQKHVKELDNQVDLFHLSDIYQYQSVAIDGRQTGGDTNTYKIFLERANWLLAKHGKAAQIVKADVYKGQGATGLRQMLLHYGNFDFLYALSNEKRIFPSIHHAERFALVGFTKSDAHSDVQVSFAITIREAIPPVNLSSYLTDAEKIMNIPRSLIERMSPDTLSIMEFRSQHDVDIAAQIYGKWPLLGTDIPGAWHVDFTNEFHMTNNRNLFNLDYNGWPLYEGKMIHQFTHQFSEPRYWVEPKKGREELARMEIQRVEEALDTLALERSLIRKVATRKERVKKLLASYGRGPLTADDVMIAPETPRLSIRTIAANTNERTIISTILPSAVFAGNSLAYVNPWKFNAERAIKRLNNIKSCYESSLPLPILFYLCGVFNSFVLDYVIRFKVSANVNIFYVYQLPVPRLTPQDPYCRAIAHRVARLVCIGPEFDDLRGELLGDVNAHLATIQDERQKLQNEIDALVAHLYGLRREDMEHILYAPYTFPLVKSGIKDGVMAAFERVEEMLEREI